MRFNPFGLFKKSTPTGHITPIDNGGQPMYIMGFNGMTITESVDVKNAEGQRDAYLRCPIVATVINRKVQAALRAKIAFVDSKGNDVKTPDTIGLEKLLRKPNHFQSWGQFHALAKTMCQIHGKAIIYCAKPDGQIKNRDTKMMFVLPNWMVRYKYTEKYGPMGMFEKSISKYIFTYGGYTIDIEPTDILEWDDQNFNFSRDYDFASGGSRLLSCSDPVNTIIAAYEAQEQLLTSAGAIGVLSNASKDISGTIPIKDDERQRILNKYEGEYGLQRDKNKIIITDATLSWQPITRPTRELMLFESIEDSSRSVSDVYNYPNYLLGFKNNSTYNNMREAKESLYEDAIIPEESTLAETLTRWWKDGRTGNWQMIFTWNHLAVMQQSDLERADALMKMAQTLEVLVRNGALTPQEMARIIDIENQ